MVRLIPAARTVSTTPSIHLQSSWGFGRHGDTYARDRGIGRRICCPGLKRLGDAAVVEAAEQKTSSQRAVQQTASSTSVANVGSDTDHSIYGSVQPPSSRPVASVELAPRSQQMSGEGRGGLEATDDDSSDSPRDHQSSQAMGGVTSADQTTSQERLQESVAQEAGAHSCNPSAASVSPTLLQDAQHSGSSGGEAGEAVQPPSPSGAAAASAGPQPHRAGARVPSAGEQGVTQHAQRTAGRTLQEKRAQRRARQRQRRSLQKQQEAAAAGVTLGPAEVVAAAQGEARRNLGGGVHRGGRGLAEMAPRRKGWGSKPEIAPKEEDLGRWFEDAVRAAEREYALVSRRGQQEGESYFAAVSRELQGPLGERLDYMGFQTLPFPPFAPLFPPRRATPRAGQQAARPPPSSASTAEGLMESSGSVHRAADTLEVLVTGGGGLPVLASQWHLGCAAGGGDGDGAGKADAAAAAPSLWDMHSAGSVLQESHAVHAEEGTAAEHAQAMIGLYEEFVRDVAGVPAVAGRGVGAQQMRGAATSYTLVAVGEEGRAVQVATSHNLADNLSRSFREPEDSRDPESDPFSRPSLYQMAAAVRSPLLGCMGLTLGDDRGLRLPPLLAPTQVAVVPVFRSYGCSPRELIQEGERVRGVLKEAGVRAVVDARRKGPGPRFGAAERMGVPLRIEIGPRELSARSCVITRRDTPGPEGRMTDVDLEGGGLVYAVRDLLDDMQSDLRWAAAATLDGHIVDVTSYYELKDVIEAGKWARGPWAGTLEDEAVIQEETCASLLCVPLQQPTSMWGGFHTCLYSGYQASEVAIFGRPL